VFRAFVADLSCVFVSRSAAETIELGRALASQLKPGDVVGFYGDLGAGKTTMIKGVAAGLRVADVVKSPSFVIVTEYAGRLPVYHVDLYRLGDGSDFGSIGLDYYLDGEGVCLIEWAERAEGILPDTAIRVRMSVEGSGRRIEVTGLRAALQPVQ
jgi:tRNA threonylcarbamoyladenosine biosynthesis protein TsaE